MKIVINITNVKIEHLQNTCGIFARILKTKEERKHKKENMTMTTNPFIWIWSFNPKGKL